MTGKDVAVNALHSRSGGTRTVPDSNNSARKDFFSLLNHLHVSNALCR